VSDPVLGFGSSPRRTTPGHARVGAKVQIESDDGFQLLGELGIVTDLERLDNLGWVRQMRRTLASLIPAAAGPWCACSNASRCAAFLASSSESPVAPGLG
jgi:hypothetical protein